MATVRGTFAKYSDYTTTHDGDNINFQEFSLDFRSYGAMKVTSFSFPFNGTGSTQLISGNSTIKINLYCNLPNQGGTFYELWEGDIYPYAGGVITGTVPSNLQTFLPQATITEVNIEQVGSRTVRGRSGTYCIDFTYQSASDYSASTISSVSSPVEVGSQATVNITGADASSLTHTLTFSMAGVSSVSTTLPVGTLTYNFTVPASWGSALTSSDTSTATVSLVSKINGIQIGSASSRTFSVTLPSSYKPTVDGVTATLVDPRSLGRYVQGYTSVKLTAGTVTPSSGTTISSYTFTCGSKSVTVDTNEATILIPAPTGTVGSDGSYELECSCVATDSRNRSSDPVYVSGGIIAYKYTDPALSSCKAIRSDSAGTASDDGAYFVISGVLTKDSLNNTNSATLKIEYAIEGSGTYTQVGEPIAIGADVTSYTFSSSALGGSLTTSDDYVIRITLTDNLSSASTIVSLGTLGYTMFFKRGGLGVGIGTVTKQPNAVPALEISNEWGIYYGSVPMQLVYVGTSAPSSAYTGMIWIKPES